MSYVGNTNTTQAFTPAIDYFSGNGSTVAFTLSRPVASVAQVQVVVNNVAQNPTDAYTVLNNTITFTGAPSIGTNNIYVQYTSPITQVIQPGAGTVTSNSFGVITDFTTTGNTVLGNASTDTLNVGNGGLVKDASGNVGIGTSSPAYKFQVNSGDNQLVVFNESGTWTANGGVVLADYYAATTLIAGVKISASTATSGYLTFHTGGTTERMRIDSSGNVGIGGASPGEKLYVSGAVRLGRHNSEGGEVAFENTSGGIGAFVDLDGGNNFRVYNGTASSAIFYTSAVERMRITAAGELMVGSTNATASRILASKTGQSNWNNRSITLEDGTPGGAQPGIGFHAAGNNTAAVFKMWGGSNNFECRNAADSGFVAILASAFPVSSDYRIKTDVVEFGSVLSNVLALRPVNYEKDGITGREYGLIAHEAAEHFPDLVQGEKDGIRSDGTMELQTVSYSGLTSVLVKAIQEQQAIITALTARIEALEGA